MSTQRSPPHRNLPPRKTMASRNQRLTDLRILSPYLDVGYDHRRTLVGDRNVASSNYFHIFNAFMNNGINLADEDSNLGLALLFPMRFDKMKESRLPKPLSMATRATENRFLAYYGDRKFCAARLGPDQYLHALRAQYSQIMNQIVTSGIGSE
jgi:hypothetical protein